MKKYLFRALLCIAIIVSGCKEDEIPNLGNGSNQDTPYLGKVVQSGESGENATFTFYSNGLLKIEGTGAMCDGDFQGNSQLPWNSIRKDITKVEIADGITSIGDLAFSGCTNLTSVVIPNSVKSIGHYAFYKCSRLTSATLPYELTSIGERAFYGCSELTTLDVPCTVTDLGREAFKGCYFSKDKVINRSSFDIENEKYGARVCETEQRDGLLIDGNSTVHCRIWATSVTIPQTITKIGDYTFQDCTGLTSMTIPYSVRSIGRDAFHGCTGLTAMTIPYSVGSIGYAAFQDCTSLASVIIPSSVTRMDWYVFTGCSSLTHVDIPTITEIWTAAFWECSGLNSVTIPNTVKSIGSGAFYNCKGLATVICRAVTPPSLGSDVFFNDPLTTLYVPAESVQAYMNADGWKEFKEIKPIP